MLARLLIATALTLSSLATLAAHRVQVEIDMRDEIRAGRFDPARDQVGLRGGGAPLSWDKPLLAQPAGEGRYVLELLVERLPPGGQPLPYKFRIERAGQAAGEGWETGPNRLLEFPTEQQRLSRAFNAQPAPLVLSRAGQIESLPSLSSRFVSARGLQVWLPPGYERDTQRRYPVLYLQDGQNVFDAAAAGSEWQADETAQRLVVSGQVRPFIIVAISSNAQRVLDYTPSAMVRDGQSQGGGANAYARYLIEELKPFIDQRYRTLPDAGHTAVGGSSLGGLFSLWLALHHGEHFGAALVVSPSLWWDQEWALRDAARVALPVGQPRPQLWIDMGTAEGETAIAQLRRLRSHLFGRGWTHASLNYLEAPGAGHDESAWAARMEPMLRFLDKQAWK